MPLRVYFFMADAAGAADAVENPPPGQELVPEPLLVATALKDDMKQVLSAEASLSTAVRSHTNTVSFYECFFILLAWRAPPSHCTS